MFKGMLHLHITSVIIFLIIYLLKTILLLLNKNEFLERFTAKIKIPEMVISTLFLVTGIYLWINSGDVGSWLYIKVAAVLISIPLAVIGFKRKNKMLALLSFILLLYAYGVAETKSPVFKKESAVPLEDNAIGGGEMGKNTYMTYCSRCHGADGMAGLSGASNLVLSELDYNNIVNIVREGKGEMTPFKDILSDAEISAVAKYVEGFRH
jgi:uncharacterized membrane protein SirB2